MEKFIPEGIEKPTFFGVDDSEENDKEEEEEQEDTARIDWWG